MTPTVRPATTDDASSIAVLEAAAFGVDAWSEQLVAQTLSTPSTTSYLVAESAATFLGYVALSVVGEDAELQRIAVPTPVRRTGLGRVLLEHVLDQVAAAGATRLLLEVREDNTPARAFYTRAGFLETGQRPRYYRDGAAAVLLERAVATPEPTGEAPS